jgi:HD-like signal output (HDOD) protein
MSVQKDILQKIEETPSLPQGTMRLLDTFFSEGFTQDKVKDVVTTDPGLSSHVLKMANMLFHTRGEEISSVIEAKGLMGDTLFAAASLSSCFPCTCDAPLEGYEAGQGALMRHCLGTAVAAREFATKSQRPVSPGEAFASGMLHDLGKVLLSEFLKGKAPELMEVVLAHEVGDFLDAERGPLGMDHAETGAALAHHLGMNPSLCQVLRFHHHPVEAEEAHRSLVYAVHLGDVAAMLGGGDTGADAFLYHIDEGYSRYFKISDAIVEQTVLAVTMEYEKLDACCPERFGGAGASRPTG